MAAQDWVESPDGIAMEAATDDVDWANQLFTTASARSDLKGCFTVPARGEKEGVPSCTTQHCTITLKKREPTSTTLMKYIN
jgi:hypothetical protein